MDSFSVLESQCGIDTSGLKTRPLERRPKRLSELSPFFTAMSKKGGAHCCYGRSPSGVRIGFGIEILFLQSQLQFFCAELSVIRFGLSNLYIKAKDPFFVKRTHLAILWFKVHNLLDKMYFYVFTAFAIVMLDVTLLDVSALRI